MLIIDPVCIEQPGDVGPLLERLGREDERREILSGQEAFLERHIAGAHEDPWTRAVDLLRSTWNLVERAGTRVRATR